jgi:hypothetical protein
MRKYIELTPSDNMEPQATRLFINVAHIEELWQFEVMPCAWVTEIRMRDGEYTVNETPEEILALIDAEWVGSLECIDC